MAKWMFVSDIHEASKTYITRKGDTKEEAVRAYLEEERKNEKETWELEKFLNENIAHINGQEYHSSVFEPKPDNYWENRYTEILATAKKVVRKKPEKKGPLKDFSGKEFHLGDKVAFIRSIAGGSTRFLWGEVTKICNSSIVIFANDDTAYRVMTDTIVYHDQTMIPKAAIVPEREERTGEVKDATGYPIREGDKIAYMADLRFSRNSGIKTATIKKIQKNFVYFDVANSYSPEEPSEFRRSFNRVVVLR